MNWRDASAKLRFQVIAALLFLAICGGFSAWLSLSMLASVLRGSAAGVSVVEFHAYKFVGLPLAVACVAFVMMGLLPGPAPVRRKRKQPTHSKAQEFMFGVALCCVPLTPMVPLIGRIALSTVLEASDYRTCPVDQWRRPPICWVRTGIGCPAG